MRRQRIKFTDPQTRQAIVQDVEFYTSEKYSSWVLVSGQTGFRPFAGQESSPTLYKYKIGQNIFDNNQGRVCALKAKIHGNNFGSVAYGRPTSGATPAVPAVLNQLEILINQARVQILQDTKVVHDGLLGSLIEPLPQLIFSGRDGTPASVYEIVSPIYRNDSSLLIKGSQKAGVYWTPPLMVAQGRSIEFNVTLPTGITVGADLQTAGIIIKFELATEELPQMSPSPVRI
jgi:hypothetical protein